MADRIALIPAYEPTLLLPELVKDLRAAGFLVIVVDDGSGDAYEGIFRSASEVCTLLRHKENRGKGAALKTGFSYILKHHCGNCTVVTLDSDGQHRISDTLRVCQTSEEKPDALILGSRGLKENVPLRSRFGNSITRFVYALSTGFHIHDTQTGLRAFQAPLLAPMLKIPGDRYEYEMNVLLTFAREKYPIIEVEISTVYLDNNRGSHFDTLKDSYRIYKEILRFSASSFISFLLDYGLYSLFSVLTAGLGNNGLIVSNVFARVASASVNYTINRKLVFQSKASIWKSVLQYALLAAVILVGNTLLLQLLVTQLQVNRYLAKLLTELFFFMVSWLIQRCLIFRHPAGKPERTPERSKI